MPNLASSLLPADAPAAPCPALRLRVIRKMFQAVAQHFADAIVLAGADAMQWRRARSKIGPLPLIRHWEPSGILGQMLDMRRHSPLDASWLNRMPTGLVPPKRRCPNAPDRPCAWHCYRHFRYNKTTRRGNAVRLGRHSITMRLFA